MNELKEYDLNSNGTLSDGELKEIKTYTANEYSVSDRARNLEGINKLKYLESINIGYWGDRSSSIISELDLSDLSLLEYVNCRNLGLKKLNLKNCYSVYYINCSWNSLSELDTGSCSKLRTVECYNNNLKKYDSITSTVWGDEQNVTLDLENTTSGYVIDFRKISTNKYSKIKVEEKYLDGATFSNGKITWKKLTDVPSVFVYEYPYYSDYTMTVTAKINKSFKNIRSLKITLDQSEYLYDGTEKKPIPTITDGSYTLKKNTDYKYSYSDNVGPGTAKVVITGLGKYNGTVNKEFVVGYSIDDAIVQLEKTQYIYTGTPLTPKVNVYKGDDLLVQGSDYTVEYIQNDEVGNGIVIVRGKGTYIGSAYNNFRIVKSLKLVTITLSKGVFTYDGSAKCPSVTIYDGTEKLTLNEDYTVEYQNNIDMGEAVAVVTGKGDYVDSVNKKFAILKDINSLTINLNQTSYSFDGNEKKPTVTVLDGTTVLKENTNYKLIYTNNTNAGTGTVEIKGQGFYTNSTYKQFTINKTDIKNNTSSNFRIKENVFYYTGSQIKPTVVSDNLIEGTDFTVSYSNNIQLGTGKVIINGIKNYYGSIELEFLIQKESIYTASAGDRYTALTDISYEEDVEYNGTPVEALNYIRLKPCYSSSDYKIKYQDNYLSAGQNSGYGVLIIEGIGNLYGEVRYTFSMHMHYNPSDEYFNDNGDYYYDPISGAFILKNQNNNGSYYYEDEYEYSHTKKHVHVPKPGNVKIVKVKRKKKTVKIKVKKTKNAYGYQVRFFYKKNSAKKNKKYFYYNSYFKKSFKVKLPKSTKCYLRVRAYYIKKSKFAYGKWSKVIQVK